MDLQSAGPRRRAGRAWLAILWSLVMVNTVAGLSVNYCSSQNTGADSQGVSDNYQSNGACKNTCKGFAFAILQGKQCWCSNYAPGEQGSTSDCNSNCPGFPFEKCGNPGQNLYAYFQIGGNVAGTQGLSTAAPTTQVPASPSTVIVRDTITNVPSPSVSVVLSLVTPLPDPPSPTPDPPTSTGDPETVLIPASTPSVTVTFTPTPSWTPTPFASVQTVLGSIQTIILTPTQPPQPAQTNTTIVDSPAPDTFWNNAGKVAGTFVVVGLVIIGAVAAAIFFLARRMRRRDDAIAVGSNADEDAAGAGPVSYMTDRRRSNLTLTTSNMGGLTRGSSNEKPSSHEHTPATISRRTSMPLVHDQRLNPAALYSPAHENGSHVSVASFRDDRDYSRPVLHIRNPDAD